MPRLTEVFQLFESKSTHYTIEPDGQGARLLSWETVSYNGPGAEEADAEDDTSYAVEGGGDIGTVLGKLTKLLQATPDEVDRLRRTAEEALPNGEAVYVCRPRKGMPLDIDITTPGTRGGRDRDSDPYSYEDDNPNNYF